MRAVGEAALRGELLDVLERLARARPTTPRAGARAVPGVSRTSPPPGSSTSCRCVVVCRPSPSSSRISRVASSSSPASVFTSVDLPTPDEPSSAIVRPGTEVRAHEVEPVAGQVRDRVHRQPKAIASTSSTRSSYVGREVGLREDDHGLGAALPGHRDVALEAAQVEVLVQRHEQEDRVDVRGEHLLLRRVAARPCARTSSGAGGRRGSSRPVPRAVPPPRPSRRRRAGRPLAAASWESRPEVSARSSPSSREERRRRRGAARRRAPAGCRSTACGSKSVVWLSVQPRSCNAYKRGSLSEGGWAGARRRTRALRGSGSCRSVGPTSL